MQATVERSTTQQPLQWLDKYMNIPEELKSQRQWVCWVGDKTPINPLTLRGADTTKAITWGSFEQAVKAIGKTATYKNENDIMTRAEVLGVGFVLANGYAGVDLDSHNGPIPNGILDEFIQKLDSYTERSRSGDGFHIIGKSNKNPKVKRKKDVPFLEMYAQNRYFIMTGDVVENKPIRDFTEEFIALNEKYLSKNKKPPVKANATNIPLDDAEILSRAKKAKNGDLFERLFRGDWAGYPSQSEADQAFCNILAFWTGRNAEQMERIFRMSGLYREKWEREDYRTWTIQKAIDGCREAYTGVRTSPDQDFALKPVIITNNRFLPSITEEALKALVASNHPEKLFIRNGEIVKVSKIQEKDKYNQSFMRPVIKPVNESSLRGYLARSAQYVKAKEKNGETLYLPTNPPLELVRDIMAQDDLPLPLLCGIVQAPIMRWDGSIYSKPGYDVVSSLFYAPERGFSMPDIADKPTNYDIKKALNFLDDIVCDFPFNNEASKTNFLAELLTVVLRNMIEGPVPMLLIDKPLQGTGASLLASIISIISSGREPYMTTAPSGREREEEWRKKITAILLEGHPITVIDNVDEVLHSGTLCALLTSVNWADRILGRNENVSIENRTCWIATGNNIRLAGDLPRRCFRARLDANQARPWERDQSSFKHPHLLKYVREYRGELLAAIYTLARGWIQAGRPAPTEAPPMGSFEDWRGVIGGILEFAGVSGFLQNSAEIYESAEIHEGIEPLIEALYQKFGEKPVSVKQIQHLITYEASFKDVLPDWLDPWEKGFTRKLGRVLARKAGVVFTNGYRLKKCGATNRALLWKVCLAE